MTPLLNSEQLIEEIKKGRKKPWNENRNENNDTPRTH